MFITNRYQRLYNNIINNAMSREIEGYVERHHIIPKCMGGSNESDNIVRLTAREHFICHRLLTKCTEGEYRKKLIYASWQLGRSLKLKGVKISSRLYEQLKKDLSYANKGKTVSPESIKRMLISREGFTHSEEARQRISEAGRGRTHSEETLKKMSESAKNRTRRPFSDKARKNMSDAHKGLPSPKRGITLTDEHREKISESMTGHKKDVDKEWSQERREELSKHFSKINKGKPKKKATCPHCEKTVAVNVYSRCHGDKCKLNQ